MAKFAFTAEQIEGLQIPSKGIRIDYDDGPVRGFAIQTSYTGGQRFLLVYVARDSGRERRMVIGEYGKAPKLSISAARRLAAEKRALADLGRDPWLEAKQTRVAAEVEASRQASTLGNLMTAYVQYLKDAGKPSWREVEKSIGRNLIKPKPKIAALAADRVTVDDVMPVFHRLAKEGKLREAEKLRAYLRAAYTAARRARTDASMHAFEGFRIVANPLTDLEVSRPKEAAEKAAQAAKERKWALSESQLQAYWHRISAMEDAGGALLRLHLLTGGQRVVQLARATVSDLDGDKKTITLRDTKGRRKTAHEHVVPLIPDAMKTLEAMRQTLKDEDGKTVQPGPFLFTLTNGTAPAGYHNLWEAMQVVVTAMVEAKEVDKEFTPGTIRKTVETRLQGVGVTREVRAYLLSHGLGGVQARHYEAHDYDDEKRQALLKLRRLLEPRGKVVPFMKSGEGR